MRRVMYVRLIGVGVALLSACGSDTGLSIEIITPSSAVLDPTLDERLAALTLIDEDGDRVLAEQPFRAGDDRLTLPRLPLGFRGDLRLELLDGARRVLGLGRMPDARLTVDEGTVVGDRTLRFYVRKPLAYVGSARSTSPLDITRSGSKEIPLPGVALARVSAMAALGSGRTVLVATTDAPELFQVDTRLHEVSWIMNLTSPARRIAIDPTDRMALLMHDGAMTFLPLPENRMQAAAGTVIADPPGAIAAVFAADGETAFIVHGATVPDCAAGPPGSSMQRRTIAGSELAQPITLPFAVTDIDIHPVTGNPIVASPCRGAIVELDRETGAEIGVVFDLASVSEVAVVRRSILGIGSRSAADGVQELHARVWPGDSTISIPWPKTRFYYRSDDPLTKVIVEISPWRAEIRDTAIGPELDRVVMAVRFDYRATNWCSGATAVSWGHLTASLASATVVSYEETKRDASAMSCTISGGVPPASAHEPTSVAILFGGT